MLPNSGKGSNLIIIYRSSSIGDIVLASACLDLFRKVNKIAQVVWISSGPGLTLIQQNFPNLSTIDVNKTSTGDIITLLNSMGNPEIFINLQKNLRSRMLGLLLSLNFRTKTVTYSKRQWFRLKSILAAKFRKRTHKTNQLDQFYFYQYEDMLTCARKAAQYLNISESLWKGKAFSPNFSELVKDKASFSTIGNKLPDRFLAIAPGAAHFTKKCPIVHVAQILDVLASHFAQSTGTDRLSIVLLGSSADTQDSQELITRLTSTNMDIYDFTGRTNLPETAFIISHSMGILCNDSSLAHIAEAMGVGAHVLFGPTSEAFGFKPWRKNSITFSSEIGCRPCSKHGKTPCRYGDKQCFLDIKPEAVAHHLYNVINEFPN